MVGNVERVFGAVLNFSEQEKDDTDTIDTALDVVENKNLIPFAIDPFGNYICYTLDKKEIVFWNHETGKTQSTGKALEDFMNGLY